MTAPPRYGLAHGREWIALPRRRQRLRREPPLFHGQPVWLPRLRLAGRDEAWTTDRLDVALERVVMLRQIQALTVYVQRIE
jgi:hypothetical protein